jgi:hypothetical protein
MEEWEKPQTMANDILDELKAKYGRNESAKNLVNELFGQGVECSVQQDRLIDSLIRNEPFSKYPVSTKYQISFYKHLVDLIETKLNEEVNPVIYEHYINLLSSTPSKTHFLHFYFRAKVSPLSLCLDTLKTTSCHRKGL